jgi:large subunit ribosomal protein L28
MARACDLTGKSSIKGHYVSHSNVKTIRRFNPNLQVKKFFIPELDQWIQLKVCTSTMRTIDKKGIFQYLKELQKKGSINIK